MIGRITEDGYNLDYGSYIYPSRVLHVPRRRRRKEEEEEEEEEEEGDEFNFMMFDHLSSQAYTCYRHQLGMDAWCHGHDGVILTNMTCGQFKY